MHLREVYERERPRWGRLSLGLWIVVANLALVYLALRWGGRHPVNLLPSAD